MTTDADKAAERLRRCKNGGVVCDVYDHVEPHLAYLTDQGIVVDAYLRETDPTPITEEFARSVAVRQYDHGFVIRDGLAALTATQEPCDGPYVLLWTYGAPQSRWHIETPMNLLEIDTIGEFWTACRLFGVQAKGA